MEQNINRVEKFLSDFSGLEECEICAGLQNGEIKSPEWLAISESTDHMKIWDSEDPNQSQQMGFKYLSYSD